MIYRYRTQEEIDHDAFMHKLLEVTRWALFVVIIVSFVALFSANLGKSIDQDLGLYKKHNKEAIK